MPLTVTLFDEETGDETELSLPTHKEACPRCEGEGTHINPAVDGNGLSADDFAGDPDFADNYFSGVYDVRCEECQGQNVIDVVDEERFTPDQRRAWEQECEYQNELARERRLSERGIQW